MTLLLNRTELLGLLSIDSSLDAIRAGFAATPSAIPPQRVRTDLVGPGTATALIPGLVEGIPAYTVKVNAKFPAVNPALRGIVCLHDERTGELLAVLDSATITAWRTGLAAALGTHTLARQNAGTVGVIGAGAQASLVVRGLRRLRTIDRLLVHDRDPQRAKDFYDATVVTTAQELARQADIVILATWSREPILTSTDVREGTHLTSLGADEPGKVELSADLLTRARTFVDDVQLASASGALGNVGLGPEHAQGILADVVTGKADGRVNDDDVTVYAPVGLPWQDLALSWIAYQAAIQNNLGTTFDWLS